MSQRGRLHREDVQCTLVVTNWIEANFLPTPADFKESSVLGNRYPPVGVLADRRGEGPSF